MDKDFKQKTYLNKQGPCLWTKTQTQSIREEEAKVGKKGLH